MAHNQGHVEIKRSGDQLVIRTVAENGEILSVSERLTDPENALKNIKAQLNLFGGTSILVVDGSNSFYLDANGNKYSINLT